MRKVIAVAIGVVMVAGCSGGGGDSDDVSTTVAPESSVPDTTVAEAASFPSMDALGGVGDCSVVTYDDSGNEFDFDVDPVPVDCAEPHDHQVYFVAEFPGGPDEPYPGYDSFFDPVFESCAETFEATFDTTQTDGTLESWARWPLEEEWNAGLRTYKCTVTSLGNSLGETQLVGDASSAGLTIPGHLVVAVADFDGVDLYGFRFANDGTMDEPLNLTRDQGTISETQAPPSLAADLSMMAYAGQGSRGNTDVYLLDSGTGVITNLTDNPAADFAPAISPDGTKIVFGSDRHGGETNLYVMNIDGTDVQRLTTHTDRDSSADWSPDGSQIVFRRRTDGNSDIWVVNADGTDPHFLVGGPAGEYDPVWSPDGSMIALTSDDSGNFEIYVYPVDSAVALGAPSLEAAGATRLTDIGSEEGYPAWTPDGEFIVFNSDRHGVDELWVMRVDGTDQSLLLSATPVGYAQVARALRTN